VSLKVYNDDVCAQKRGRWCAAHVVMAWQIQAMKKKQRVDGSDMSSAIGGGKSTNYSRRLPDSLYLPPTSAGGAGMLGGSLHGGIDPRGGSMLGGIDPRSHSMLGSIDPRGSSALHDLGNF